MTLFRDQKAVVFWDFLTSYTMFNRRVPLRGTPRAPVIYAQGRVDPVPCYYLLNFLKMLHEIKYSLQKIKFDFAHT